MPKSGDLLAWPMPCSCPGFAGAPRPTGCAQARRGPGRGGAVPRNIADPAQVAELTAALRAENPAVAGRHRRGVAARSPGWRSRTGSTRPGGYALGVVDDVALTEALAADLGRDLAAARDHHRLRPSADVNSNPDNPVIGLRAFGADPDLVSRHTAAFVRGLQSPAWPPAPSTSPATATPRWTPTTACPGRLRRDRGRALRPFRAAIEEGVRPS